MRGPKPTTLTVIQGGIVDAVPAPDGFPEDHVKDWNTITSTLASRGLLDEAALLNVPAYCGALATIRECSRVLDEEGRFIKNKDGIPRAHPALAQLQKATEMANRMAAEFGFTPSSRSRKGMGGRQPDHSSDGVEDLI